MTFAFSSSLQRAVYQTLKDDSALSNLIGAAIYDAVPYGALPDIYIVFGGDDVTNASDFTGDAATHEFTIAVHSTESGFKKSQAVAARVSALLPLAEMTLSVGNLIKLRFLRANMRRYETSQRRRIDLRFRAFLRA